MAKVQPSSKTHHLQKQSWFSACSTILLAKERLNMACKNSWQTGLYQKPKQEKNQNIKNFRQYKTFFGDDIWNALTEQARFDEVLDETITINSIAASWITKDRLPVINVTRDYRDKSATIIQVRAFLLW